ncbi:hypothetical protein RNJ44_02265 [Nakaseomyces bracarensis]|uniref:MYND-type domain-containing protein n=1 Tax=Nakaseomyces bracarensis TaxID=273131 RepID=A0ABR4NMY3_9SACH
MRDSEHRSISNNRPVITITSTVYDRRALDIESTIPLINSLNHLTYLTSNSGKIRETVANDGALERLVAILHNCHLSLYEILNKDLEHVSKHERGQNIYKRKRLALCSWKWTLAFQCLVLTGTRGTEQIRKKVVLAGVIPVLATVLDNYLLFHQDYDFIKDEPVGIDINEILSWNSYRLLRKNPEESFEEYLAYIMGHDKLKPTEFKKFDVEELTAPVMTLATDFRDIWKKFDDSELAKELGVSGNNKDNCFFEEDEDKYLVSAPRNFFIGKIIPKQDDVIWSLQLLAFITKYTYMKQKLQNVELVDSLSFRGIIDRYKKRRAATYSNNLAPLTISKSDPESNSEEEGSSSENDTDVPSIETSFTNPVVQEIYSASKKCKEEEEKKNTNKPCCRNIIVNLRSCLQTKSKQINHHFDKRWKYAKMSKKLDEKTWVSLVSKKLVNSFPLVEKYTVSDRNPHDIIYWSSVIMRNSCRKNEATGVRQCANFSCGKWEQYPREFAKCRRCKRTKYCSRECQLQAWKHHRYWCHEVGSSNKTGTVATEADTPASSGHDTSLVIGHTNRTTTIFPTGEAGGLLLHQDSPEITDTDAINNDVLEDGNNIDNIS